LTVGSETVSNSTGTGNPPAEIASIAIRQGGTGSNTTGNVTLDNITVIADNVMAVSDVNSVKTSLVKNTLVKETILFAKDANIQIVNTAGQVVKTANVTAGSELNVSSLAKGVYIVTGTVNGERVSQKIIKE
jgi:hypothetical protein